EAEERGRRRACDAVLSRACFGDDPLFSHSHREQRLSERVVDLVCAGVRQIFALQQDPCAAAAVLAEPTGLPERCRAAGVLRQQSGELSREAAVRPRALIFGLERLNGRDQSLGYEAAAKGAVIAAS